MVFYTLCISVFNLALGFALALYLQSRGMSPGWLRPDLLSRLKLPRFGRDRLEPPDTQSGNPSVDSVAAHAAPSSPVARSDHQPIELTEFSGAAAPKTGLSE